ncbi:MAG: TonB-dependent receptor [Pseudomonadota bacterium]
MKDFTRKTLSQFSIRTALSAGVGMGALLVAAQPAMAQEDDTETRTLQTVTVTATKREQTLQDVPVAVSVVDNTAIEKAEIQDLGDLQSLVPSLSVGQLQSSANTNFIIRGFGNGANNAGIEPSVGVFIDGVYRSRSAAQIADLPNLQRVEVLRGPQSTLFGKNASAGVISIVTRAPQFEQSGSLEASVGNYNAFRLKGDITGPLSDKVAYSLSANYNTRDGYADDLATGSDVNQRDRWGVRGQLLIEPTEDLSFRIIGDFDKIDEICCVAGNVVNGPTGDAIFALGGAIDAGDPFSYEVFNNFDSDNEIENSGVSLETNYDFDFATLTAITAYRSSDATTNQDSDFTSADIVGLNLNETEIETFTQEIRLTSPGTGRVDWMIGGFYFDETVEIENDFQTGVDFRNYGSILAIQGAAAAAGGPVPSASDILAGLGAGVLTSPYETVEGLLGVPVGTFGAPGVGPRESFGQDNSAYSIFGTLDFHFTDRLTGTAGLNYTSDDKDAFGTSVNTDAFSNLVLPPPLAGLATLQFLPTLQDFPNVVEGGSTNDSNTTYTLRLAYDATDNINVYGSFATGFKASSWNLSRDSRPLPADFATLVGNGLAENNLTTGTRFAGPEESEVIELGVKGQFDTFGFNLAIFDQTIEGFQSNVFTGTGFELLNAGEQSTSGVEFDATWNATANLTLGFAGTFLDPVYDSFPNSASGDLSGQQPSGIPEISTSTTVNYDFVINDWDAFVRADWQHTGDSDFFDDPGNQALIDAAGFDRGSDLINASAGFVTANGIGVSIWGRNIFDEEFVTTAFPSVAQAGSLSGYPNQPATYGVTVRKTF